jgi:hypothetical protein
VLVTLTGSAKLIFPEFAENWIVHDPTVLAVTVNVIVAPALPGVAEAGATLAHVELVALTAPLML